MKREPSIAAPIWIAATALVVLALAVIGFRVYDEWRAAQAVQAVHEAFSKIDARVEKAQADAKKAADDAKAEADDAERQAQIDAKNEEGMNPLQQSQYEARRRATRSASP